MNIVTRASAMAQGLNQYFTGRPCKHGHIAPRILSGNCIDCQRTRMAEWLGSNGESDRKRRAAYRVANLDQRRAYDAAYHAANAEKRAAYRREWHEANKDRDARRQRDYRNANGERMREIQHVRRARERGQSAGPLPSGTVLRIGAQQKWKCVVCFSCIKEEYHVDHIMPLALGGLHAATNLQLLCPPCNQSKHAQHPVDFMQQRGFLL